MKTMIQRDDGTVTIRLTGFLDFETTQPFRESLNSLAREAKACKIVFDLGDLSFVGSSGITAFIQALRDFNGRVDSKPSYLGVKSEFRKLIAAFDTTNSFQFGDFDSEIRSIRSLDN